MMSGKIRYMQNNIELEKEIVHFMDRLDPEETTYLLKDIDMDRAGLNNMDIENIKERTFRNLNRVPPYRESDNEAVPGKEKAVRKRKGVLRNRYAVSAAAVLLCVLALKYSNNIVYAFQHMLSLIPGVGIIENNREIIYHLKEPVSAENDRAVISVTSGVATDREISLGFQLTKKNYTEEQLMADKNAEWEVLKKGGEINKPNIYIQVDGQKFRSNNGSWGGGLTENCSYSFELDPALIDPSKSYRLVYEDYDIGVDFRLVTLEQYDSLNDIGITAIHDNISLTATSSEENNRLKVHVYPVNYSDYDLISFDREYNFEYFGKKLVLKTDKGDKAYTLPDSYGSGMNAAYTFDLSDGAKYSILSIPYVVVETREEAKITLPIPEEGEIIHMNKEIPFDMGSVVIKDVEKVVYEEGNNNSNFYAELKVDLEYKSKDDSRQLVGIDLTNKKSEGKSLEYDAQHRIKTICYMLEKSHKSKIKLYLVKPRYVLMDEYELDISDNQNSRQ